MSTITWEKVQLLAAELGATVTRKKKFLSSARQCVVTSPSEKEWHSGYHKNDKDLVLTCAYLASVKRWKQAREEATPNPATIIPWGRSSQSSPRRFNRDRDDARHNPNQDPMSLAMLQAQIAASDDRPVSHSTKTHSTPSHDYDSSPSDSGSSDSSPSGD